MPELPEVEVIRASLAPRIHGARITRVYLGKPLRWPFDQGGGESHSLIGQTIISLERRGKYLLFGLSDGLLVIHLGMSGRLQFCSSQQAPGVHDHFELRTTAGCLRLHDPRRFGAVLYARSLQSPLVHRLLGSLGVEPLNADHNAASNAFSVQHLYAQLQLRSTPVKQALLSGKSVVGVGNIYASEALFVAGIRPQTPANRLSRARVMRLHAAIVQVLRQAISLGGASIRDFRDAQGKEGHFQLHSCVYGREGQPCVRCSSAVRRLVQAQRASYYCPRCQK